MNFDEFELLKEDGIVKEAFNIFVKRKLISEGYFYAKGCIEKLKIDEVKLYLQSLEPGNNGKLKSENTLEELSNLIQSNSNKLKELLNNSKLSFDVARAIIYLILKSKDNSVLSKGDYAEFLLFLLNDNNSKFECKDGFIKRKDIKIISVEKIFDFINNIELAKDTQLFYRGHSDVNFIAEPSIFRNGYYENEYLMYQELVVRCQNDFINCNSHFDFLKLMQHYGLPTRLLDLTLNPLVALYFACENDNGVGEVMAYSVKTDELKYERSDTLTIISCLPMFKYEEQRLIFENRCNFKSFSNDNENIVSRFMDEIHIEKPSFTLRIDEKDFCRMIFVMAGRNNHRIYNQKGAFAAFGLPEDKFQADVDFQNPIDNYRYISKRTDEKIVFYIPENNKKKIRDELEKVGIDKSFIYPEIDDVASYIKFKM